MPKLSSITFNEFTGKDSFAFAEEIVHQGGKIFMGSLEVDSLFTNIPLKETISICTNLLLKNVDVNPWLPRNRILCSTIFFTIKRMVWPWDRP